MRRGHSDTKHVFVEEPAPYLERGQSVVVYHHLARQGSHEEQIARLCEMLRSQLRLLSRPIALCYRPWSPRAFFVLAAPPDEAAIGKRLARVLAGPWAAHFQRIDIVCSGRP
jgi:hypothetical protein